MYIIKRIYLYIFVQHYNNNFLIPNSSPCIGVGVSKFGSIRDNSEFRLNGTKPEVRLNDKKMSDGKVFQAEFAELLDVEVPEIFRPDHKEAMFDPVYEGCIRDNMIHT